MEESTGHFGVRMNSLPKWVATTTLTDLQWNATRLEGDVPAAVAALKEQQPELTLMIDGSSSLVESLRPHGLIDEFRLMIFPVIVGTGRRFFPDGATGEWSLTEAVTTSSGVIIARYVPAAGAA